MNYADNYHDLLLFLEQAESDINNTFSKHGSSLNKPTPRGLTKIEEEISEKSVEEKQEDRNSDPEDIELNLQILINLGKAIRSDLSDLLANHNLNDLSENDLPGYQFCTNRSFIGKYKDQTNFHQDGSNDSASKFQLDDDDKSYIELDALSDLESHSPSIISGVNIATQTSPSPSASSTNLTWPSSSDSEFSEDCDPWDPPCAKSTLNSGKSNSAPVLEKVSPSLQVSRQSRSQSDRHLAEIEATEACKWLRATGFPQYAQMYEDMLFPIQISQVAQDHPFLENDVLHSLFRRLKILNSCAHLHQHKITHTDESDDEFCALSENWTYQSDIRRWSRTCANGPPPNLEELTKRFGTTSLSSQDKDDVFEKANQSPRERLKRAGSSKFRRRRDGMCFSERDATFDSLSPVGSLKTLEINHVSDSEITPRHYRKFRTNSFEKPGGWAQPSSSVERLIWQKLPESPIEQIEEQPKDQTGEIVSLHNLSASQLQVLRKLALLKLTAHMEKYCPSHRTGWNLDLPKFLRKIKAPVYKDKNVFGVPITITLQRTGQVLPRNIEQALRWLQMNAADHVGIFRKPGVKSRIQALRNRVETNVSLDYSDQQSYDVADMVKQYFRELPEALLTNKLSETFILIFQHIPVYLRKESVLWALLLMPDEHLEVLQALLHFMLAIAKHSDVNQMNESNLAMCFAPSLFHYNQSYKQNVGSPHAKELAENKAAYDCLLYFLKNYNILFKVPKEFITQCKGSEMKETKAKLLNELGFEKAGWREYLQDCQVNLLKEAKEKQRGWITVNSHQPRVELAYKKVADGIPLRVWKVCAEIEAPPSEVLHRILRERHIWDPDIRAIKCVMQLETRSEVFQYVRGSTAPRPAEEYLVVRTWRTDLARDACLLVETSVEHPDAYPIPNTTRGLVLASRYLVEPCGSGRSRLLHFSRVDTMGRTPDWYQKHFGHLQAFLLGNLQSSFSGHQSASGPESKV